ncbi:MFS transporter [Microbacterium sp. EYE_5]|uniref:MFS transporter n=1 Tax=unclassified Microbacterium TaxID=2609290 RepID=UPI002003E289|nr:MULTISPECIES: MFS transporter [unclassified Microbacterium]MCK6081449.1 MFS transporter [Microbacterium sp. EYE_382]MCK6086719.1 MFS transporter [Microbacterium sp. EYE_384]MCK6123783.1 MFS transporter [Microbacterium sp. EYE_80]MCK6126692.1 MFS transporter [Microbacterium sp. EYE_79]MCK6142404.1 MFS transporter [Microbacterium sp. EYE_39]
MRSSALGITAGLIGWFIVVEIVSGILQGFYVPLFSDIVIELGIRDADVNWFEAGQLLLCAIVVPILAKLGDMFGHKRILLVAAVLTALASWGLAFADSFWTFLLFWSLQGFYVVWLPLEIALIFERGRQQNRGVSLTRRAAGLLVVGLEAGAIIGALAAGRVYAATGGDLTLTLMVPAVCVTLVAVIIWIFVPESTPSGVRSLDTRGVILLAWGLLLITGALAWMRLIGELQLGGVAWAGVALVLVLGVAVLVWFVRHELRQANPVVDMRVLAQPEMWPVQATAFLVGISLLGAQGPLSTYAGTDSSLGYGLGLDATERSYVIGLYLVSLIVGAVGFAATSRRLSPRIVLIVAAVLVGVGYALFLPFHVEVWQVLLNLSIAGIGCGALVGAMPAAAAAAAPFGKTGEASGMTNTTKTVGGAFSSAIFGVVLAAGVGAVAGQTASSLGGYMTVWAICAAGGFLAAILLMAVPKVAFADAPVA